MMQFFARIAVPTAVTTLLAIAPNFAIGRGTAFACLVERSTGLNWENGSWATKSYRADEKFVLVVDGESLTFDSAAKAMGGSRANCTVDRYEVACTANNGGFLLFHRITLRGGMANLSGTIPENGPRPSVFVQVFACQPF